MPQDTFTIRLLSRELNETLCGGKINRINQPSKEELSFIIYTGKRVLKLTINANASDCGVYFTEDNRQNPPVAPNFCMLLRKHLQGAELLGIATPGFERILIFRFMCYSDFSACERELYVEIMGKYSNVILTENGTILGALKTTMLDENCKRAILPGAKYTFPAPQDKVDPSNLSALRELFATPVQGDVARFLFTHVAGLAPVTAQQLIDRYSGGDFAEYLHREIFSDEISPCVVERDGVVTDFFARRTEHSIPFDTISQAEQYFYGKRRAKKSFETFSGKLKSAISAVVKKQEKRLAQILDKRRECADAEQNRIKGELLTANLYAVPQGAAVCEVYNYYDENGGNMKITLDTRLSPAQNAQAYFKRYRKQKRTLEILQTQETEVRAELDYTVSLLAAVGSAENEEDLQCIREELQESGILPLPKERQKREKTEYPYRRFEKDGFEIFAGRNNYQNDRLVRHSAPDDVWLHAQKYHSAHVVIRTLGRNVPNAVLLYAAQICAKYSDGKLGGRIPIDYCAVKNVKKPPKSKAGFVIYNEYKTILAEPLEM